MKVILNILFCLICLIFFISIVNAESGIEDHKNWNPNLVYVLVKHPSYMQGRYKFPSKHEWVGCDPNNLDAQIGQIAYDGSSIVSIVTTSIVLGYSNSAKTPVWEHIFEWPSIRDDNYVDKKRWTWWNPIPPYYHMMTLTDTGRRR